MKLYQVVNWDKHFEGAKTKTYNNKTTCQLPTKHGLGYKKLVKHKEGAAIFGAWCALIQVLSRHEKPRQGYCTDTGKADGIPLTPDDLELLTDIPAKYFGMVYELCSQVPVNWLVITQYDCKDTTLSPQYPPYSDSDSDSDNTPKPPKGGRKRFTPPELQEVQQYCKERQNNVNPESFVDFYASKGWMVGKNKMKDWKAAVRTWEKHSNGKLNDNWDPINKRHRDVVV